MNTPKISVIVPIYNVEQYLPKCIDSVLSSVEQDFEILLIDDGSTDNSGKICDDYEEKDSRIRAFHKINGGQSSARNKGLDEASGEWIFFLDSDDYIDKDELTIPNKYSNADVIQKSAISVYGIADAGVLPIYKKHKNGNGIYSKDIDIWRMFVNGSVLIKMSFGGKYSVLV